MMKCFGQFKEDKICQWCSFCSFYSSYFGIEEEEEDSYASCRNKKYETRGELFAKLASISSSQKT